jgi:hypothetical protein
MAEPAPPSYACQPEMRVHAAVTAGLLHSTSLQPEYPPQLSSILQQGHKLVLLVAVRSWAKFFGLLSCVHLLRPIITASCLQHSFQITV